MLRGLHDYRREGVLPIGGYGELTRIVQLPDVKDRLAVVDFEPVGNTPAEFAAFIRKETLRWAKLVKDAGGKVE